MNDTVGHNVHYTYQSDATGQSSLDSPLANAYPDLITYNRTTIRFYWETRPDRVPVALGGTVSTANQGQSIMQLRLRTIAVTVAGHLARAYTVDYGSASPSTGRSLLRRVNQYGNDATINSSTGEVTGGTRWPSTDFGYQDGPAAATWTSPPASPPAAITAPTTAAPAPEVSPVAAPYNPFNNYNYSVTGNFSGTGRSDWLQVWQGSNQSGLPDPGVHFTLVRSLTPADQSAKWIETDLNFQIDSWHVVAGAWPADVNGDGRTDVILAVGRNADFSTLPNAELLTLVVALAQPDGHFRILSSVDTQYVLPNEIPLPDGNLGAIHATCQPGDINGDGRTDLVCLLAMWVQDAEGWLPKRYEMLSAVSVGNGQLDLVVDADVPILVPPRVADGSYLSSLSWTNRLALGDTRRSGRADVMLLDYEPGSYPVPVHQARYNVVVGRSRGDGTYTWNTVRTEWPGGENSVFPVLVASDINGNGRADALVIDRDITHPQDGRVWTVRNLSSGNPIVREDPIPAALVAVPNLFTVGDVNGDGRNDLLFAAQHTPGTGTGCSDTSFPDIVLNTVLSNGDGTFAWPSTWADCSSARELHDEWPSDPSQLWPTNLTAADTTGNGAAGFLMGVGTRTSDGAPAMLIRDVPNAATFTNPNRWTPANTTGQGRLDLVTTQPDGQATVITTLLRQSDGGYRAVTSSALSDPGGDGRAVAQAWRVLDVNGDGRDDLVYIRAGHACITAIPLPPFCFPSTWIDTFLSNGDGTYTPVRRQTLPYLGSELATQWRPARTTSSGRDDLVQPIYGADGKLSVLTLLGKADGTFQMLSPTAPTDPLGGAGDVNAWKVTDVNGDGLTDLIQIIPRDTDRRGLPGNTRILTLFSAGEGTWADHPIAWNSHTLGSAWGNLDAPDALNWRTADLTGQAEADLTHVTPTNTGVRIHTLLPDGNGSWTALYQDVPTPTGVDPQSWADTANWLPMNPAGDHRDALRHLSWTPNGLQIDLIIGDGAGKWTTAPPPTVLPISADAAPNLGQWKQADFTGAGQDELAALTVNQDAATVTTVASLATNDLLVSINNNIGATTTVKYENSTQRASAPSDAVCHLPSGLVLQTVKTVTTTVQGAGAGTTEQYEFGCAAWSNSQRRFLGWQYAAVGQPASIDRDPVATYAEYQAFDEPGVIRLRAQWTTDTVSDTATPPAGKRYAETYYHYQPTANTGDPRRTFFINAPLNTAQFICNRAPLCTYSYISYDPPDQFGNAIRTTESKPRPDGGWDQRTTETTYYSNPPRGTGPYLESLPRTITVTGSGATATNKTTYCYDNSCAAGPRFGQLTDIQTFDSQSPTHSDDVTHITYDMYGNPAEITDPTGAETTIAYDPDLHLLPARTCSADLPNLCTSRTWDPALQEPLTDTAANSATTTYVLDALGRPTVTRYPDGGADVYDYQFKEAVALSGKEAAIYESITEQHLAADGTVALTQEANFDGLGRTTRISRDVGDPAHPSTSAMNVTYGDASPEPYQQSHWYELQPGSSTPAQLYETMHYDGLGRVTRQTHPDATNVSYQYGATASPELGTVATLTTTNELGTIVSTISQDAWGQVRQAAKTNQGTTTVTSYLYDALGRETKSTDALGNVTATAYDSLNRPIRIADANLGSSSYTYDAAGHIQTRTDARGNTTTLAYDPIGRLTGRTNSLDPSHPTYWRYDETGHGSALGRLTTIQDASAIGCKDQAADQLTYDRDGNVTSWNKCVLGKPLTFGFSYDTVDTGRLNNITYPDATVSTYSYDAAGLPRSLSGIVDTQTYTANDAPLQRQNTNHTSQTNTYDLTRGWLRTSNLAAGTTQLSAVIYPQYLPTGLLLQTTSSTDPRNTTYKYDDLGQLTTVAGDGAQSFTYNALGDMTSNSTMGTYTYPPSGLNGCGPATACPHPEAVSRAGKHKFSYDASGNLQLRDGNKLLWNSDNQPAWIQERGNTWNHTMYDSTGQVVYTNDNTHGPGIADNGRGTRYYGPLAELAANGVTGQVSRP